MRTLQDFNQQEKEYYDYGASIRNWGKQNRVANYGFTDSFYTRGTKTIDNKTRPFYRFKKHSFTNLLHTNPPDDLLVDSEEKQKLERAFMVGLLGQQAKWNTLS